MPDEIKIIKKRKTPEPPDIALSGVESDRVKRETRRERKKLVYHAGEGTGDMTDLLGGKGAGLQEMTRISLPVPPYIQITTDACNYYYEHNREYPRDLDAQVMKGIADPEKKTGKKFGDPDNPLLISVRSGAKFSMPGMMDTVLNLGLNDRTVEGLAKQTDERTAWDSYRRFIMMWGSTALGLSKEEFDDIFDRVKEERLHDLIERRTNEEVDRQIGSGIERDDMDMRALRKDVLKRLDPEVDVDTYKETVLRFKEHIKISIPKIPDSIRDIETEKERALRDNDKGKASRLEAEAELLKAAKTRIEREGISEFPEDPLVQLRTAIDAVFSSWMNPRAITYRNQEDIPHGLGTAVNIQAMVFGNTPGGCSGVGFTRNKDTGKPEPQGDFLPIAQGEDVVSGARTPLPVGELDKFSPRMYRKFLEVCRTLEDHYREVQDFEFTIEGKRLFSLNEKTLVSDIRDTLEVLGYDEIAQAIKDAYNPRIDRVDDTHWVIKGRDNRTLMELAHDPNEKELKISVPETPQSISLDAMEEGGILNIYTLDFYMLQTRNAKRTPRAAVKIAVDMVGEGRITREDALARVTPQQYLLLQRPMIDPDVDVQVIATGTGASQGAASAQFVFTADDAVRLRQKGHSVILVREETNPNDVGGIYSSEGVLTARGGKTSHAAIVTGHRGIPSVVGCGTLHIDEKKGTLDTGKFTLRATRIDEGGTVIPGDYITIRSSDERGEVILGQVPMIPPDMPISVNTLLSWANETKRLGVRANADTPEDSALARKEGAIGIGLCRTEHQFLGSRLPVVRRMILAETDEEKRASVDEILPMQRGDFVGIFKAMDGLPVTIRLLDPPLHEFLPKYEVIDGELTVLKFLQKIPVSRREGYRDLVDEKIAVDEPDEMKREIRDEVMTTKDLTEMIESRERLLGRVKDLREANPMLGLRGVRLGIDRPEIYEMQVRAIFEAAAQAKKDGIDVKPEIMIPLVSEVNELKIMRELVDRVAGEVMEEQGISIVSRYTKEVTPGEEREGIVYAVGTMIETPRACMIAGELAKYAEFISFGTNDLTQTTYGLSRDDAATKFLPVYVERGILSGDPFIALDRKGVGQLMLIAIEKARLVRPDIKIGICGEHGSNPDSVKFCHKLGLSYVSPSPLLVPVAVLAAAQAVLEESDVEVTDTR